MRGQNFCQKYRHFPKFHTTLNTESENGIHWAFIHYGVLEVIKFPKPSLSENMTLDAFPNTYLTSFSAGKAMCRLGCGFILWWHLWLHGEDPSLLASRRTASPALGFSTCHLEKNISCKGVVLLRNSLGIIAPSCILSGLSQAVVIHIWCPDSNFGRRYHAEIWMISSDRGFSVGIVCKFQEKYVCCWYLCISYRHIHTYRLDIKLIAVQPGSLPWYFIWMNG